MGHVSMTTPLLGVVCHLGFDTFYLRAKFDDSSFSRSKNITGGPEFKVCHVTLITPLLNLSSLCWDIAYLRTKFDHYSFNRSRDMVDSQQNLNGSRNLTTPLSWMICHACASTCYDQPIYQIWSHYLQFPPITKTRKAIMGWFKVVRVTQGH